ncbi:MAG: 4-alpha-glucanotransferase [Candidatus Omnitrophica bacterium]|nr:4-alpha-glucanotransferase [Candidatus Omnitrophota bacterium]
MQEIGSNKRAGVLVPLFSVYSRKSLGIGDFNDLKLLIDWCEKSSNALLQLLPLNEVGMSFCPYDSLSSFALEPSYIFLEPLINPEKKSLREELKEVSQLFPNGKPHIDLRIKEEKLHLLRDIFSEYEVILTEINKFKQDNLYWLEDFALFKVLKEFHQGLPWYEWQPKFRNRDKAELELFKKAHQADIEFQIWLQWLLFKQLQSVKSYAEEKKIFIKGDLPILVSRDSADVWAHPEFFKLDFAAGAPPDMYCAKGQRWGVPTYNWDNIASDGFHYIKEKLKYAQNFYHCLRIDHVVGLFRIWSIPYNEPHENQGLNGFFDPHDEALWGEHGRRLLKVMLESTSMLLCAEDLGTIPKACTDSLNFMGIPGNDVQRWTKDWKVRHDFLPAEEYRKCSVTMLSTHDTTNWAAWWKYEAGTVDEALFVRKCNQRGIDYTIVRDQLFDRDLSNHDRLRWLNSINTAEKLIAILAKPREQVADFIELYINSYLEKEKLWKLLGMKGAMQEEANTELIRQALKYNLATASIFSIQLITDWLSLAGIFKGDPYPYRWSMTIPISLEELLKHRVTPEIKKMVAESGRI